MPAYWIARARIIDPIAFKNTPTVHPPSSPNTEGGFWPAAGGFRSWKVQTSSIASW